MNINTKEYWDSRFRSGDWEEKRGRTQTQAFARGQVKRFGVAPVFDGVILDFGCGLGDAIPIYRDAFPAARLIGVDVSSAGIEKCRNCYGQYAEFLVGDHSVVPPVDIIVASNVFEHLSNDMEVAQRLSASCQTLYITVPYRQTLSPGSEHINRYDKDSFSSLRRNRHVVFASREWSEYGWHLWYQIRLKNIVRRILGRPPATRSMQIMFEIAGSRKK